MSRARDELKEDGVTQSIRDVMAQAPRTVIKDASLIEAARIMRDLDVGDVLVVDRANNLVGILTDRDIVIRAVAEGRDVAATPVMEVASEDLVVASPKDTLDDAERLLRDNALRRLPVVEDGKVIGVVSIGDLAIEREADSTLAEVSAAPGNE